MEGPNDAAIEEQIAGETTREPEDEPPPPPPGGKALLRLLTLLGSAGYEEAAEATIGLAVTPEQEDEFRERAAALVVLPTETAPRRGGSRSRSRRAAAPATETPAVPEVAEAFMEAAEVTGPPTPTGPQWRPLGPWTIPNGQTYGASRVNVSGRIAAIAIDPTNAAHVLVGAANGGIWETFNSGASWAPRTDYQATLAVGALAFDPANARTVYGGLGEGNWWWWLGTGVLRSNDGGTTWTVLCTAPFVGQGFYDLVVDPANGRHLLAATTGGLYVSNDGGVTWTQRRSARTWSIAMAPGGGASAEILAASSDGLWRSTNGGTNWNQVALPGAPAGFNRLAVAISRSNPGVAYAFGAGPPNIPNFGPTPYLWRRAGGSWTLQARPPGVATGQSWYDWFLAVAPDNANQIYLGAISVHRGTLSGTTWTWVDVGTKAAGDSIHPDQHAIAFRPGAPATIYVGNDGGMYRSPDRGATWQHLNNGLEITEFEYIAQNYGSSRWLVGGTQDNGTERWRGSPVWDHVADGDGGDCGVNRVTPSTVFHTFYGMSPQRSTTNGDFGTWTSIFPTLGPGEPAPFYPPFECSATNGDTIAIGGGRLYVSRNSGSAWTPLPFPGGGTATALYVPDANTVYVGLGDGRVLRTTWTGAAWAALTALGTPRAGAAVSDIQVDWSNASRIWVTHSTVDTAASSGRVWRSDNGGANWTNRTTAALPNLSITAIQVDPANANRAWVSASLGVYQTVDGGASWTNFAASLPNCYIGDLLFQPHARVLRAGTRNRGVWEIPVDGWMTQPQCGRQWTGTLTANQTQRWFTFGWPATWHVVWTVMPTSPAPGAPQLTWNVQVERASAEYVTYWISVTNLTAASVTFDGRFCILSRY